MSGTAIAVDWIAVDWGTSNLRVWAMGADDTVLGQAGSDEGMGTLAREGFKPALLRQIGPWLRPDRTLPVFACGMVGSRQGWLEAPYRKAPCTPMAAGRFATVPTTDPRIAVRIVPGISQAVPADVMRGEETQIAGVLAREPGFDGVICLPGTHSKWVRISAGEIVSFQTFMTGELFALLSKQSVLRHGMQTEVGQGADGQGDGGQGDDGKGNAWDEAAFAEALADAISRPDQIAARLFRIRAEGLLDNLPAAAARARLSGLLIGIELAAARPYWLGQDVVIVGAKMISTAYRVALAAQGMAPRCLSVDAMTLAGLAAAHASQRSPV